MEKWLADLQDCHKATVVRSGLRGRHTGRAYSNETIWELRDHHETGFPQEYKCTKSQEIGTKVTLPSLLVTAISMGELPITTTLNSLMLLSPQG